MLGDPQPSGMPEGANWQKVPETATKSWKCGYCHRYVSSNRGWEATAYERGVDFPCGHVMICPACDGPTYFSRHREPVPGEYIGERIRGVPEGVKSLYNEACVSATAGAYTASVLTCRKLLMHVAVDLGAEPDKRFVYYVEHLANKGFIPPNSRGWVDHIRDRGNEANHQIVVMTKADAASLIKLSTMLLRIIYELPLTVPTAP